MLHIAAFRFNTEQHSLFLSKLVLSPTVNKETFYRITGHQQTIWTMGVPSVNFIGLDWQKLLHEHEFCTSLIEISEPIINLYFSYLAAPDPSSKIKFDPIRLLHNSPLQLNVKDVSIKNATINYTELNDQSIKTGTLTAEKINAHANNIVNIKSLIAANNTCSIKANALIQHKSPATASMLLSLDDSLGEFTINGALKDLDAFQVSDLAESLNLLKIDSLHLSGFNVQVHGNQNSTHEEQTVLYTGLKVELKKRKDSGLKTKPMLTLAAETFFVYPSNPTPGKPPRFAITDMRRDTQRAFVSMIVENVKCGTKKIVIKNEEIVPLKKDKNEIRPPKGFFRKLFGKNQ
jgi:hypothetical protein